MTPSPMHLNLSGPPIILQINQQSLGKQGARGEGLLGKGASLPVPYTLKRFVRRVVLEATLGCPHAETEGMDLPGS